MKGSCGYVLGYPKNRTHLDILRQYLVNINEKGLLVEGQSRMHFRVPKKKLEWGICGYFKLLLS